MSTPRCLLTIALFVLLVRPALTSAAAADRTYTGGGNATMEVGGEAIPLLSAEGGAAVGIVTTVSSGAAPDKRISGVKVEDIVVSLPATNPPKFVSEALTGKAAPLGGSLTFVSFDQKTTRRQSFQDALLSAITWPALDGASKEAALMRLAITPSSIKEDAGGGGAPGKLASKQKQALASTFRVEIPGLPTNRVATVAPIEIRARSTGGGAGEVRKQPAGVSGYDVSNIKLTVSAVDIADWRKWHDDAVINGGSQEKTMRVILLGPNMKDEIVSLDLSGVGIVAIRPDAAVANSEKVARVEVELYAESAKITPLGDGAKTASAAAQQPPAADAAAAAAEPAKPQPAAIPERPIRRPR
jgi:hypothetical protein